MVKMFRVQGSAQPPAKKTASQIEKETDEVSYEKANIEYRIMNIECRISKEGILPICIN